MVSFFWAGSGASGRTGCNRYCSLVGKRPMVIPGDLAPVASGSLPGRRGIPGLWRLSLYRKFHSPLLDSNKLFVTSYAQPYFFSCSLLAGNNGAFRIVRGVGNSRIYNRASYQIYRQPLVRRSCIGVGVSGYPRARPYFRRYTSHSTDNTTADGVVHLAPKHRAGFYSSFSRERGRDANIESTETVGTVAGYSESKLDRRVACSRIVPGFALPL